MSEHEYEHHGHEHDEDCTCGCHDHEHAHHGHEHDEDCTCGCHDHDHAHHHIHGHDADGIHIEHHMQDEACVVSGIMQFCSTYDERLRERIAEKLEALAAEITARGGIVGHVKAAAEVTGTEMFSVTDVKAMVKTADTQEICVKMAAIVFAITPEAVENMMEAALRELKQS